MLTKNKKSKIRSIIFRHLDGVSIASTLKALNKYGIIDYILLHQKFNTISLSNNFKFNTGYLNIALRLLASQGLIVQNIIKDGETISYSLTKKGKYVFQHIEFYDFCLPWYKFCIKNNLSYYFNTDEA